MKKIIIPLVILLLLLIGGGAALAVWLLKQPPADPTAIEVVGQSEAAPEVKEARISVIRPFATQADLMEALDKVGKNNKDTVGWLTVPNTDINSSVVQSNNNTYYLRINESKQPSTYGCYFADYTCSFGPRANLSSNTVIYGHSDLKDGKDGPKFSQLFRFTDEAFAKANPTVCFATPEDYMMWEIFAVFYTESDMQYYHGDMSAAERAAIVKEAKEKSLYNYDIAVGEADKVLTLSTCTVKYGTRLDQRFVVMARLLPADADLPQTATLTANPTPSQPNFKK